MQCCLWFRSVVQVRGPWPKRYSYHLSINDEFVDYKNLIFSPCVCVCTSVCACVIVCLNGRNT